MTKIEKQMAQLEKRYFDRNLTDSEQTLTEVFFIFAFCEEDLTAKLVNYVLKGDQIDPMQNLNLLQSLKATDELQYPILLQEVRLYNKYVHASGQQENDANLLEASLKRSYRTRDRIFTEWTDFLTRSQLIRFGKVLAALPRNFMFVSDTPTAIPLWLSALIHHCGDAYENWSSFSQKKINFKTKRQKITMESFADLLEEDGLDRNIVFDLLADTNLGYDPVCLYSIREIITKFVGFESYILNNKDAVLNRFYQLTKSEMQLAQVRFFMEFPKIAAAMEDFVIQLVLSKSKTVAKEAFPFLSSLNNEHALQKLNHYLLKGNAQERGKAAELMLVLTGSESYLALALETEKVKAVQTRIQTSLANLCSVKKIGYQEKIVIPPFTPQPIQKLVKDDVVNLLKQSLAELLINIKEKLAQPQYFDTTSEWQKLLLVDYETFTERNLEQIADFINGDIDKKDTEFQKSFFFKRRTAGLLEDFCLYKKRILSLKGFSLYHLIKILKLEDDDLYSAFRFPELYHNQDLRQVLYELNQSNPCKGDGNVRYIARQYLISYGNLNNSELILNIKGELAWPFFAEHLDLLKEGLELVRESNEGNYDENDYDFMAKDTLQTLDYFPSIPTQFIPKVLEIAFGDVKILRPLAQQVLSKVPNIYLRVEDVLSDSKQEVRRIAIEWLAQLKNPNSIKALHVLLEKEKNELVRATILTALESFGEDISSHLSPEVLLKEAVKELTSKIPTSFEWFDHNQLPICYRQDGKKVNASIIYYWVVLAVKLKMPEGNGLFKRYLSLLDQKSQQALGKMLLHAFITQDTISLTEEEALEIAKQRAPQQLAEYHAWGKQHAKEDWAEKYRVVTLDEVIVDIKHEELNRYLGSAIKSKGMLAFIHGIEAQLAITMVMRFMKDHYKRRAQIEVILTALAESENALIIQLILSIARRHRTNSIQLLARKLVEGIAERNSWSKDELADRTIPTAGIEDDGSLRLDYGSRVFIAKLNKDLALSLFSPEGKEIKALPEARKDEDPELVKEAKKLLSNSKKELKQIITLQTERLFESMCVKHLWRIEDWNLYFIGHPIMKRLIEKLVWINVKEDGSIIHIFSLREGGSLMTVEGSEIILDENSYVMLAHSALMDPLLSKAWKAYTKDYKETPLFMQFEHDLPEIEKLVDDEILDRQGWITDAFILRNIMQKLGYKRGEAPEDDGFFDYYSKIFESVGCEIVIYFSGNHLPEENVTVVLLGLEFHSSSAQLAINEIPPILLAEGYGDYLTVAKACRGFDPEWEKKSPWYNLKSTLITVPSS